MSFNSHNQSNGTKTKEPKNPVKLNDTSNPTTAIPNQDHLLMDPMRSLDHLEHPDYVTPPMGFSATFDGLSSVCDPASTTCMSDVDHLPSPIHPTIWAPSNSQGSSSASSITGRGALSDSDHQQPQRSLPHNEHQLLNKKTRTNSRNLYVSTQHLQQQLRPLNSAGRSFSEFTAADVFSETGGLSRFNIRPVQRIVSIPVQSPLVKERELIEKRPIAIHEVVKEEQDKNDNFEIAMPEEKLESRVINQNNTIQQEKILGTYITFDQETSEKQTWHCIKEIGEGSFSKVYLTKDSQVAVKVTNIVQEEDEETKLRIQSSLIRELEILQNLKHQNIAQLIGSNSQLNQGQVVMALKYYPGGDLFSVLVNHKDQISPELIRNIFADIVSAVRYLHHNNICHRDIKLENVLISYNIDELITYSNTNKLKHPLVVLSDFGLSKRINPDDPLLSTRCGSEDYVSPELLLGMNYDGKQNDCWSMGVLLYTMLEDRLPFDPLPSAPAGRRSRNKPSHRIALISWNWYCLKDEDKKILYKDAMDVVDGLLVKRNNRLNIDDVSSMNYCKGLIN